MEETLKEIWCKLLEVGTVSNASNFFLDGGDSAKLVHLALAIRKEFAIDMPLMSIFEAQSFGNLAVEVGKRLAQPRPV